MVRDQELTKLEAEREMQEAKEEVQSTKRQTIALERQMAVQRALLKGSVDWPILPFLSLLLLLLLLLVGGLSGEWTGCDDWYGVFE